MGLLDKVKNGEALSDIKKNTKKNQTVTIKSKDITEVESINKAIKNKIEESEVINRPDSKTSLKGIEKHLSNSILRELKSDILDESRFQEYIYKTISKRFEIISKNSKTPKYKIINSVLAQFLNDYDDEVQEEIKRYKKKINDI